nr:hypothetical protein [Prolinoborus fasciculus]
MNAEQTQLKQFLENYPLYKQFICSKVFPAVNDTTLKLKEIEYDCVLCNGLKPLHNTDRNNLVISIDSSKRETMSFVEFTCVTCGKFSKTYLLHVLKIENNILGINKIGEFPQKELPRSKALSKFFAEDKQEYNKAVVCLANGYGVAAFAYMRRVVEKNIHGLLDLIAESAEPDSRLAESLAKLKTTSPMSDKIEVANYVLPDYLKPDGFNPLGQIYGLLSDGVHSLPDEECLDKAQDLQACLEFLISELAAHKKNREEFKSRLSSLRKR